MDALSERICLSLRKLRSLAVSAGMEEFAEGETALLYALRSRGEEFVTPSELSESLGVTKGRITALVNSLTRKGLIRLEKMPSDARKERVIITEAGRNAVETKLNAMEAFMRAFVGELGEDKANQLADALDEALKNAFGL